MPDAQKLLKALETSKHSPHSEGLAFNLQYNPGAKNLLVAAKVSELQKRLNIVSKCLSGWENNSSISSLLERLQTQLSFISEQRLGEEH